MASIADVWISVMPETSKVASGIKRVLRDLDDDAYQAGRRWGSEIERGIGKPTVEVEADTAKATAEIDKATRDRRATVHYDADTSKLGAALKTHLALGGIASLPAASTAIVGLAGALNQLGGASLVMPGVMSGLISSVGTAVVGMHGMSDALKAVDKASDGTQASVDAANKSLAGLAPNAAEAVKTIAGLKGTFTDLQHIVAQNMFAGVSDQIKQLAATSLPALTRGLNGISLGLNRNISQAFSSLGSGESQGILGRILGNTGEAQSRLTAAIDPLIHSMGVLASAGSDTLPRLATALGNVANRFDLFITSAGSDGRLSQWINSGISGLTNLGNTILNLGKSFESVVLAAGGGGGLLTTLEQLSARMAEFLRSAAGQQMLSQFFADGRNMLGQLRDIAVQLAPMLPAIFDAARESTSLWLPLIRDALSMINSIPGGAQLVVTAFVAWKTIDGIASLATALKGVSTLLRVEIPASAAAGAAATSASWAPVLASLSKYLPLLGPGAMPDQKNASDLGLQLPGIPAGGGGPGAQRARRGVDDPPVNPLLPALTATAGGGLGGSVLRPSVTGPSWSTPSASPLAPAVQIPAVSSYVPPVVTQPSGGGGNGSSSSLRSVGGYTSDQALLSLVPPGTYNPSGDLIKGLGDCSSAVEDLVNLMDGRSTAGRSMATGNAAQWLVDHGFLPTNVPMPGTFQVGFSPSHMQATLPGGTPFNWGSNSAAANRGIGGSGAWDPSFTQHYFRPVVQSYKTGPTGAQNDPYFMQYPQGYKPPGPDTEQMGKTLGSDLMDLLLPEGFKNPAQFGGVKFGIGILNGLLGLQLPSGSIKGGDGASMLSSSGGSGGMGILGQLMSNIPQPFGALKVGGQEQAPGQWMPTMPNEGGANTVLPDVMNSGLANTAQGGQTNHIDARIDMRGAQIGLSANEVMQNMDAKQNQRARQPLRALPTMG